MKIKLYFFLLLCFIKAIVFAVVNNSSYRANRLLNVPDDRSVKDQRQTRERQGIQTVLSVRFSIDRQGDVMPSALNTEEK